MAYVLEDATAVPEGTLRDLVTALLHGPMAGKNLIVRSSADDEDAPIANAPGVYDSFINRTTVAEVLDSIRACVAGLHSAEAVAYRAMRGLSGLPRMNIIVQEMLTCQISGVLNTKSPIGPIGTMLAEYVTGVGVGLVTGTRSATHQILPRTSSTSRPGPWSSSRPLSELLSDVGATLEDFFGGPQEIEWGVAGEDFFVFQSRNAALDRGPTELPTQRPQPNEPGSCRVVSPGYAIGSLGSNPPLGLTLSQLDVPPTAAELAALGSVAGLVLTTGLASSHSASLCREAGLPVVVGALPSSSDEPLLVDAIAGEVRPLRDLPVDQAKLAIFASSRRRTVTDPSVWHRDDRYETVVFDPRDQERIQARLQAEGHEPQSLRQTILPYDDENRTYTGVSARIQVDTIGTRVQFKRANVLPDRPCRFDEAVLVTVQSVDEGDALLRWMGYVPFEPQERDLELYALQGVTVQVNRWPNAPHAYTGIAAANYRKILDFAAAVELPSSALAPLDGKDLFALLGLSLATSTFAEGV